MKKVSEKEIRRFMIDNLEKNPGTIARITAEKFGISRQSVNRHLHKMIEMDLISSEGKTKNKRYRLKPLEKKRYTVKIVPGLQEDKICREYILPLLRGVEKNVVDICYYGCTEMLNNIIDHAEAQTATIGISYYPNKIGIHISDDGIGIFNKITKELKLLDQRHAVLELSKGKLTTDPKRHTGEGIFFTSRMFDEFSILSGKLFFSSDRGVDWLLEDKKKETEGTFIFMYISPHSKTKMEEVFNKYTVEYGFSRTYVHVGLAAYGEENLVSRSQAKRLLAGLDRFKEAVLDFKGVGFIGQAFADEIFRVFKNEHPETHLIFAEANKSVEKMIKHVTAESAEDIKPGKD